MKKLFTLAGLLSATLLSAQTFTERVVFSTGGSYSANGNQVMLHAYQPQTGELDTIASFPGDFSNAVAVNGTKAFFHVGRGFGHPSGTDVLYTIDLLNGAVLDSTKQNIAGLQNIVLYEDFLIANRGFGASANFLIALDQSDLSTELYLDQNLPTTTTGLDVEGNKAVLSFTQNDSGYLAVYDLTPSSIALNKFIPLDTLSAGIGDIVLNSTGTEVFAASQRYINFVPAYNGFTSVDAVTNSFTTDTAINTSALHQYVDGSIYGTFNGTTGSINPQTGIVTNWSSVSATAFEVDSLNPFSYAQSTNFFSNGYLIRIDDAGVPVDSINTDISGSALKIAYNNAPIVAATQSFIQFSNTDTFSLAFNETDLGDSVSISIASYSNTAATPSILGDSALIYDVSAIDAINNDTVALSFCDRFNRCDTSLVLLTKSTGIQGIQSNLIQVYPNPTSNHLNFTKVVEEVRVYSLAGNLMVNSTNTNQLNVSNLPNGMFVVVYSINGSQSSQRFIKK